MTMTREEWLAARKRGIGATDAVAVCGLSPWRDALAVYCDKLSLVEPDAPTEEMEFGILAEPLVAQLYEKRTGLALVEPAERLVGRRDEPWAICSPDRFRKSDGRLVEIKTANPFRARDWGEEGTDAVPDHYAAQVVWQMFVLEVDVVDLAVLLGRKLLIYTLRRDDRAVIDGLSFAEWMRGRCCAFWFENVLAEVPPEVAGTEASKRALAALYPRERSGEIVTVADAEAEDAFRRLRDAKAALADAMAAKLAAENQIKERIGEWAGLRVEGMGTATWKAGADTVGVDWEALARVEVAAERLAAVRAAYERVTRRAGRTFRVKFEDDE